MHPQRNWCRPRANKFEMFENENGETISDNFTCEWNCYYCPAEPAHEGNGFQKQVRSYVYDGPSTRRANENGFDPVRQFYSRAKTLIECGHEVDKIECIVLGGTWDSYNIKYRDWFCKMLYYSVRVNFNPFSGQFEPLFLTKYLHCLVFLSTSTKFHDGY